MIVIEWFFFAALVLCLTNILTDSGQHICLWPGMVSKTFLFFYSFTTWLMVLDMQTPCMYVPVFLKEIDEQGLHRKETSLIFPLLKSMIIAKKS